MDSSDRLKEQLAFLNRALGLGNQKLTETSTVGQFFEAVDKADCTLMLASKDEMVVKLPDLFMAIAKTMRKQQ